MSDVILYQGDNILNVQLTRAPIAPHGRILVAFVYDESKAGTADAWIQIYPPTVHLPPDVPLVAYVEIENNGQVTASFHAVLLGMQTNAVSLTPGKREWVSSASFVAKAGNFPTILYGDGQEIEREAIQVIIS